MAVSYGGFANLIHCDNDSDVFTTSGVWCNTFNDEVRALALAHTIALTD